MFGCRNRWLFMSATFRSTVKDESGGNVLKISERFNTPARTLSSTFGLVSSGAQHKSL